MPAIILVALKLIFLAYIYLFVWQIAKAIAAHVGTGGPRTRSRSGSGLTVIRSDTQTGLTLDARRPVVLGSGKAADVVIDDPYTSEEHLRLVNDNGALSLVDLGSTTGTYVNGKRVSAPLRLHKGDSVQIGKTILEVT